MKTLLTVLLASGFCCKAEVPPFQTMAIQWDHVSGTNFAIGYRVYTVDVFNETNYIGFTNGNRYTVQNITANPQRWFVTTTNNGAESDPCFPNPFKPQSPETTKLISTSIRTAVPGVIETSTDLSSFIEQFRVGSVVGGVQTITFRQQPNEPVRFYRSFVPLSAAVPPALPSNQQP